MDIFFAIAAGELDEVRRELAADRSLVNDLDGLGNTPLHHAANFGSIEIVRYLIDNGGNVNARGAHEWTPLHSAVFGLTKASGFISPEGVQCEHVRVVELLLKRGANPNLSAPSYGTPLHLAVSINALDLVRLLLSQNADANSKGPYDFTPLHMAAANGSVPVAQSLIEAGSDINAASADGLLPIQVARNNKQGDMVSFLQSKGAHEIGATRPPSRPQPNSEPRELLECWFCGAKDVTSSQFLIFPMFRPLSSQLWTDTHIYIPRCGSCRTKQRIGKFAPMIGLFVGGGLGFLVFGWLGCILGLVVGALIGSVFKNKLPVKLEERLLQFDMVKARKRREWVHILPEGVGYNSSDECVLPSDAQRKNSLNKESWADFI